MKLLDTGEYLKFSSGFLTGLAFTVAGYHYLGSEGFQTSTPAAATLVILLFALVFYAAGEQIEENEGE